MNEKNIKLGIFVFLGFILIVSAFFYISKNNGIFGNYSELKARFTDVAGLQEGNNVLFSGIQAGSVKSIVLINEQTIEATLLIDDEIMPHIPKNSIVSIGTEGLLGNKVLNIIPAVGEPAKVKDGDYLIVAKKVSMDEMLETLAYTNDNVANISEALKKTVSRINNSEILNLMDDKELVSDLKSSLSNIQQSTVKAKEMTSVLNDLIGQAKQGKGAAGLLLADEKFENDLRQTMKNITMASENANKITQQINQLSTTLNNNLATGKGPLNAFLTDSAMTRRINNSLENIEKGTNGFNQNMEALKQNFLFRRYFKKLEKQQKEKN